MKVAVLRADPTTSSLTLLLLLLLVVVVAVAAAEMEMAIHLHKYIALHVVQMERCGQLLPASLAGRESRIRPETNPVFHQLSSLRSTTKRATSDYADPPPSCCESCGAATSPSPLPPPRSSPALRRWARLSRIDRRARPLGELCSLTGADRRSLAYRTRSRTSSTTTKCRPR
jgi:hypothetical protein